MAWEQAIVRGNDGVVHWRIYESLLLGILTSHLLQSVYNMWKETGKVLKHLLKNFGILWFGIRLFYSNMGELKLIQHSKYREISKHFFGHFK